MIIALLALLAAAEGRPLFYWGDRAPLIVAEAPGDRAQAASVTEVHAALDRGALVLRISFDRPTREALYLPDGTPVSGRLRAVLYLDTDDDRKTGFDQGAADLRTGADLRLEVGVLSVSGDPEEKVVPSAVVTAWLASVAADGRRHTLWRGDDTATPGQVSVHDDWVEVRLPQAPNMRAGARLILAASERSWDGRLRP